MNKKMQAFTLAEVLITLGIIGVVAAMTMPSLIQSYKEKVMVTRVKKFYSVFSQAYLMAVQENGTIDNWGLEDSVLVEDDEGNQVHDDKSLDQYDKFFNIMSKYLQKAGYEKLHNTKGSNGSENIGFILPDGTQIIAMWLVPSACSSQKYNVSCGDFYIKVDNKPSYKSDGKTVNSNVFAFIINPNRIFPYGTDNTTFENNCLSGKNYSRCTGWVILNENMDYLHCNDLSFNGKTKCK